MWRREQATKITNSPELQASICIGFLFSISVLSLGFYYDSLINLAGLPKSPNPYPVLALISFVVVTLIVYTVSYCYCWMQNEKITLSSAGIFKLKHMCQNCFKKIHP